MSRTLASSQIQEAPLSWEAPTTVFWLRAKQVITRNPSRKIGVIRR